MSAESINTFIFTGLGTSTRVQTHTKRTTASMFCFIGHFLQDHLLERELFSEKFLKEQYARTHSFFTLNLSNPFLRLRDTKRG